MQEDESKKIESVNGLIACHAWHKRNAGYYRDMAGDFNEDQSGRVIMAKCEWLAAAEMHERFAKVIEDAAGEI